MNDRTTVSRRLRKLRGSRKEEEIASKCGISVNALRAYESGTRVPRDEIKLALANTYRTSIEHIFFRK